MMGHNMHFKEVKWKVIPKLSLLIWSTVNSERQTLTGLHRSASLYGSLLLLFQPAIRHVFQCYLTVLQIIIIDHNK